MTGLSSAADTLSVEHKCWLRNGGGVKICAVTRNITRRLPRANNTSPTHTGIADDRPHLLVDLLPPICLIRHVITPPELPDTV